MSSDATRSTTGRLSQRDGSINGSCFLGPTIKRAAVRVVGCRDRFGVSPRAAKRTPRTERPYRTSRGRGVGSASQQPGWGAVAPVRGLSPY